MTPSQQAKAAGLKSLASVSKQSTVAVSTLKDWHKNKPKLFAFVLEACEPEYQESQARSYSFTVTYQIKHGNGVEFKKTEVVTDDWRKVAEVSGINPEQITGILRNPFKVMRQNAELARDAAHE